MKRHILKEESISKYIFLLPKLGELGYVNNQNTNSYYIIDSEWNELNKNVVFVVLHHQDVNINLK